MKNTRTYYRIFFICAVSVAATLFVCFGALCAIAGGPSRLPAMFKYAQALRIIEQQFVAQYDEERLHDSALAGAVASLGDRWSWYLNAKDFEAYKLLESNRYSGIGITIEPVPAEEGGGMRVIRVGEDTPAARAGVEPGMVLVEAAGADIRSMGTAEVRELVSALTGDFTMRLIGEDGATVEVTVRAEIIYNKPVSWEMLGDGIGYIKIANFESGAGDALREALAELTEQGVAGLVFDVRGNPGGKVSELCSALDALLPECVIFVARATDGKISENTSDAECIELPMAVLVNDASYSAAEYFAAVLDEYGAATVAGSPTTGKSRSQQTFTLQDGSALHISTAGYLTPGRVDLTEAGGVRPALDIPLTEEERARLDSGSLDFDEDPQLQAAVGAVSNGK